jgi:hypothetical protein
LNSCFSLADYSVAVLGVMAILAGLDWLVVRQSFSGPDVEDLALIEDEEPARRRSDAATMVDGAQE